MTNTIWGNKDIGILTHHDMVSDTQMKQSDKNF